MKKILILVSCAMVLVGCTKKPAEEQVIEEVVVQEQTVEATPTVEPTATVEAVEETTEPMVVGGWEERADQEVTEELLDIFNRGVEGTEFAEFVPVKLLATQVVEGTNFKFLCENGEELVIYQDLDNNCSVLENVAE